jgi:ribulose-5-phosphate 4-epimerase/fuculose-1-phosphate aldolase
MCVLHTHTVAGVAVSRQKQGLLPLNQWSLQFTDRLAYHDYEGIALDLDERARLVADLGDKFVIILRNDACEVRLEAVAETLLATADAITAGRPAQSIANAAIRS